MASTVAFKYHTDLLGPDFLVIQVGNMVYYGAYILSETTDWSEYLEDDPEEALASSLTGAHLAGLQIVLLGDLNARTACRQPAKCHHPKRISLDKSMVSTRGRWLCQTLRSVDCMILNGVESLGPEWKIYIIPGEEESLNNGD